MAGVVALWALGVASCVDDAGDLGDALERADVQVFDTGPEADGGPLPPIDSGVDGGEQGLDDGGDVPTACVPFEEQVCACEDRVGRRVCYSDATWSCCRCPRAPESERFACLDIGIVGTWQGVVTTPWVEPYSVEVMFRDDRTYAARCTGGDEFCAVFYYGVDGDGAGREYRLTDLLANGEGVGRLRVVFGSNSQQWGDIEALRLSSDGEALTFEFWPDWFDSRPGPIEFELQRVP